MTESRDVTKWPGALVETPEQREQVLAGYSPEHIKTCRRCGRDFFWARREPETCYGCWYVEYMEAVERNYADVIDVLKDLDEVGEPSVHQTGGMCLILNVPLPGTGHHVWLGDGEDTLSPEPEPEDGWGMGVYKDYDPEDDEDDGMPLAIFEDGASDILTAETKNPATAALLVGRAIEALKKHLEESG